ncbi:MAG: hypothetical protein U0640_15965 [Phycisphaerales bacterium]
MLGDFYQIMKDILTAVHDGKINELTVEQIDLTIAQIEFRHTRDIEEIERETKRTLQLIYADHYRRGMIQSSLYPGAVRLAKEAQQRKIDDLNSEANYVKNMLLIEREKFAGSGLK